MAIAGPSGEIGPVHLARQHHVGDARAGRDQRDARLAGHPGPAVGGVPGALLVPDVDDADALGQAAVVDVLDVV